MHAATIVTRVLGQCLGDLHAKRRGSVLRAVMGLLVGSVASLSSIALSLDRDKQLRQRVRMKHRLKSVDRLLGSAPMWGQREAIYRWLAREWLHDVERVLIVVDWSDVSADGRFQLLRASVALEGRSGTLYEEVHPQSELGSAKVHKRFLKRLGALLPPGCQPIVMSDAGFHASWFKLVQAQGWYFVGRLRGRNLVYLPRAQQWVPVRDCYARATGRAQHLGIGQYTRSNAVAVSLALVHRRAQGRHRRTLQGKRRACGHSQKNARREREPWLLASSPELEYLGAKAIINLYAQRMTIEQSFRDTKNTRWGLGLEQSRSRSQARLEMLLLIVHLALFVQRLIGECAKQQQLELQFMATRRKTRREISVITLGRRALAGTQELLTDLKPWTAIAKLREQARFACATFK